jgi:predicted dehydrogenase
MSVRWGILGTGAIAAALTHAIRAEGGEIVAVGSASSQRAEAFALTHDVARHHAPHHCLVDAGDVDVVYVATTNDRHRDDAIACLRAGVPVLLEKPFALSLDQAQDVVAVARETGVFLMEAMWMRFQPGMVELQRRIAAGEIGALRSVTADFSIVANSDPTRRWFDRDQGGGALLDIGVYPLTFAISLLGAPLEGMAVGELAATGVDEQVAAVMRHERGVSAWSASFVAHGAIEATVAGSAGSFHVARAFHEVPHLTRRVWGEVMDDIAIEGADLGYRPEVREVHRCLAEGVPESPRMPHELSLTVMRWLDRLRGQLGVVYPTGSGGDPATSVDA